MVNKQEINIIDAAKDLDIKYSTAKDILKKYKNEGKIGKSLTKSKRAKF